MILDTSAVIAVLFREPEADRFISLIHGAEGCRVKAGIFLEIGIVLERSARVDRAGR